MSVKVPATLQKMFDMVNDPTIEHETRIQAIRKKITSPTYAQAYWYCFIQKYIAWDLFEEAVLGFDAIPAAVKEDTLRSIKQHAADIDDLELFKKIEKISTFNYNDFSAISSALYYGKKAESYHVFDYIVQKNIDWSDWFSLYHNEHGNYPYISYLDPKRTMEIFKDNLPQEIKNDCLWGAVHHCSLLTKVWLDLGAEIETDKYHSILLHRNINPENTTQFANSREIREILVAYWPNARKSPQDPVWSEFVKRIYAREETTFEAAIWVSKGYVTFEQLLGSEAHGEIEKFAKAVCDLQDKEAIGIIQNLHNAQKIDNKLARYFYKHAILSRSPNKIDFLLDTGIDPQPYLDSSTYLNILQGKVMKKGWPEGVKREAMLLNKKVAAVGLHNKLTQEPITEKPPVKKMKL